MYRHWKIGLVSRFHLSTASSYWRIMAGALVHIDSRYRFTLPPARASAPRETHLERFLGIIGAIFADNDVEEHRELVKPFLLLVLYGVQAGDWLNPRHKGYPASCAGSASVSALQEACGWNGLFEGERDCASNAARAFSARLVPEAGHHERDPKKLREFWQWWLSEAIPTAWTASADRAR